MNKNNFFKTSNRRAFALVLAAALVLAVLSGCSGSGQKVSSADAIAKYGSDTMKLYIPGEYLGQNVISNFEKQFGVNVIVEYFDSNEMMYTKLQAGDAYDVLVPSDYMIERLIKSDMLQPLNTEKIPNKELLAEEVKNLPFDPNNTYAIPYFWGSVGLVYNEKNVDPKDIEEQGWNVLKNPKYAGHIYVYDSERDAFLMPLKALGYSANTGNEEEIQEAYEWLLKLNATMSPAYVTDEVIDGMIGGLKDIAVVYSGDAAVILNENPDMRFAMPKEGTNIWCDGMIIPANAENPALAHEFINYMLTYDAAYDNAETVGYSSPNAEVLKKMAEDPELYGSNEAYLPRSGYELDEVYTDNPTLKKMISELWIKVKAT